MHQAPGIDHRRIFGIETEYGVSLTGGDGACSAGQVAMAMFHRLVEQHRSTNIYLSNGARLYLDVGSHPEYATAEALTPMDALEQDLAGERIMADLARDACSVLTDRLGTEVTVHVFKNNVDAQGHSFGCHENYLLRRQVPLDVVKEQLVPFLVTRQLFAGAGRLGEDGYQLSQRADFLDEAVSSATTRARPMVNTRDEPHADPDRYRRLHVILGDSNRSQTVTWLKLATTHLVLSLIEEEVLSGRPHGFGACALANPGEAMRATSRDMTGRVYLDMEGGGVMSALDIQRRYWEGCQAYVDELGDQADTVLPMADEALGLWRSALDTLDDGHWEALAGWVDWAAKLRLLNAEAARDADIFKARRLDLDYHDVAAGRSYGALVDHGMMDTLVDVNRIGEAVRRPPQTTRARLRGDFVSKAEATALSWSCDWTHLVLKGTHRHEVTLMDPFACDPDESYRALSEELDRERTRPDSV